MTHRRIKGGVSKVHDGKCTQRCGECKSPQHRASLRGFKPSLIKTGNLIWYMHVM